MADSQFICEVYFEDPKPNEVSPMLADHASFRRPSLVQTCAINVTVLCKYLLYGYEAYAIVKFLG